MALGTIAVVGIAVVGLAHRAARAARLARAGADAGRIPFLGRRRAAARPSRLWAALARLVARPLIWGGIAAIALLALAAPALGLRLGEPAVDAPRTAGGADDDADREAFPQAPAPAEVVVSGPDVTGPRVMAAVGALAPAPRPSARSAGR